MGKKKSGKKMQNASAQGGQKASANTSSNEVKRDSSPEVQDSNIQDTVPQELKDEEEKLTNGHKSEPEKKEDPPVSELEHTGQEPSSQDDPSQEEDDLKQLESTTNTKPLANGHTSDTNGASESDKSDGKENEEPHKSSSKPGASQDGSLIDTESIDSLKQYIEQIESERDEIQEEYDSLLEKVGTIKQRLGERFKILEAEAQKAQEDAETAKKESLSEIEKAQNESRQAKKETEDLRREVEKAKRETEEARHETQLAKSKSMDAIKEVQVARDQQVSQKIMFDQEIANEQMSKQTMELELEQLKTKLESNAAMLNQSSKTCELQEKEITKIKRELQLANEAKEKLENQLKTSVSELETDRDQTRSELQALKAQLAAQTQSSAFSSERQQKLETEAKENQLLIGKLRHEAVILNDHLTHALRLVRKDSEGSTVDKELVSNLFVQFATCPRQDTKKFEILLLIANFLGWDDQRRQLVGLSKGSAEYELSQQQQQTQPTQMVGVVGKLAEFIENRRNNSSK